MKIKLLLAALMFTPLVLADGVCEIPKECEIISSEFSTGGGDKAYYIMEVDCKIKDRVIKYIDVEASVGGLLGFGRVAMPRKIVFKNTTEDSIECDY